MSSNTAVSSFSSKCQVESNPRCFSLESSRFSKRNCNELDIWHQRLGHPALKILEKVLSTCNQSSLMKSEFNLCSACQQGKSHKLPFSVSTTEYNSPFQLIHSDLWTSPIISINGFKYYVNFVDQFSKYTWVYLLKNKSDVYSTFV